MVDGENGFVVPYDALDTVADRLARLDDDPALRARMGTRGREIISKWWLNVSPLALSRRRDEPWRAVREATRSSHVHC